MAHPTCLSISIIFSIESESKSGDCVRFSTARMTPWEVWIPTVVEPSLMASIAYSTARMGSIERGTGRGAARRTLEQSAFRGIHVDSSIVI